MAETKEEATTRLNSELSVIETQIKTIEQNGQAFKKGDSNGGFSVEFAKLPTLYGRKDTVRSKITAWENS